jgi:hypothetical protein
MLDSFNFGRLPLTSALTGRGILIAPDDIIGIDDAISSGGSAGTLLTLTDEDGTTSTQLVTETPQQVKKIYKKETGNDYE